MRAATWCAFNGTYTGPTDEDSASNYFHFDSWRMNVQPASGCPWPSTWKKPSAPRPTSPWPEGQTHFWGYSLKLPTRDSESVSMKVDDAVDKSDDSQDVGPLQASRMWITQARTMLSTAWWKLAW